jgi:hypothetical protein
MPTPKENARVADAKEEARIKEVKNRFDKEHKISIHHIFGSEMIVNNLKNSRPLSYVPSLNESYGSLPLNSLLYSQILVRICKYCLEGCKGNLIKPYLERNLVIPVLSYPLSEYKSDFIEEILKYPYISCYSASAFLAAQPCFNCPGSDSPQCPHNPLNVREYEVKCKEIKQKLSASVENKSSAKKYRKHLDTYLFGSLYPQYEQEAYLLNQANEVISQGKLELIDVIEQKAEILNNLRKSNSFGAIPEVNFQDLKLIGTALSKLEMPLESEIFERDSEKKWVTEALGLNYNPKMPIEEYLNIIIPRKKKINSLLDKFIEKRDPNLTKTINDEIWKINKEITGSKRIELLNYLTSFSPNDVGLISGIIAGCVLGYGSSGLLGCGLDKVVSLAAGVGTTSVTSKLTNNHSLSKKLNLPKPPKKTVEWIKEKFESQEERLFAKLLSTDIPTIQVWSLRKKLENA